MEKSAAVDVARGASNAAAGAKTRRRSIWRYVLGLTGVSLALLAAVEIGAQVMGFGRRVEYVSSPAVLWQPRPDQRAFNNITNAPVTIDHRGLRAVPGSGDDSGNRIRVLALGDSVTFGFALADEQTYVARLQAWLEAREPSQYHLMNGGVNGYNFYLVRQRLVDLLDHGIKPDLLLIGFCFNEYPGWPNEQFGAQERAAIATGVRRKNQLRMSALFNVMSEVVGAQYVYRLRNMLMPRPAANPKAQVPADSWLAQYRTRVELLFDEAQQRRIPIMVIVWPDKGGVEGAYRATVHEECRKRSVPCVDLDRVLRGRDRSGMFFDFEHPRPDTVRLYVEDGIAPFFQEHARVLVRTSGHLNLPGSSR